MGGGGLKWKTDDRQRLVRAGGMQCRQPICLGAAAVPARGTGQVCRHCQNDGTVTLLFWKVLSTLAS